MCTPLSHFCAYKLIHKTHTCNHSREPDPEPDPDPDPEPLPRPDPDLVPLKKTTQFVLNLLQLLAEFDVCLILTFGYVNTVLILTWVCEHCFDS